MARLNRSTLPCIGLLVSLGTALASGCGFETRGNSPENTTGASGGAGGEGGTGGMGGAGGAMVCMPGTKKPCYTGTVETANIGNCKPGTQTCLADGTGYENECIGEVVATIENCIVTGDEDCDGLFDLEDSECVCTKANEKTQCITGMPGVCAVGQGVCSADGRSVDMCTPTTPASAENCATMEDENCDGSMGPACTGTPVWTYTPAGSSADPNYDDAIFSVAMAPGGEVVIGGLVDGVLGADGFGVTMAGKGYVAKLDAGMTKLWEKTFESSTFAVVRGVAVDKNGDIIVAGSFSGSMTIGAMDMVSDAFDIFIVKYDPLGILKWARHISSTRKQELLGLAIDDMGNSYITGSTDDPVDFGGGSLTADATDFFMASYTGDNMYRWSKIYKSAGTQIGRSITTTANGDVVVIGDSDNDTDLGNGVITKGGNKDIFVARYANAGGTYVWGKLYGKTGDQLGRSVAMATDGNVLITGGFASTIEWKSGTAIMAVGTSDTYVAKLDGTTGEYLAHAQGGKASSTSTGTSVAADPSGNVTVFGHFNGAIDFGGQEITSFTGTSDTFLVKLKVGDLTPVWTKPYGKDGHQYGWDVAVANDGKALVGGTFYTELEVPPAMPKASTGGADLFAVLANP
jgi:hypothetical protein